MRTFEIFENEAFKAKSPYEHFRNFIILEREAFVVKDKRVGERNSHTPHRVKDSLYSLTLKN